MRSRVCRAGRYWRVDGGPFPPALFASWSDAVDSGNFRTAVARGRRTFQLVNVDPVVLDLLYGQPAKREDKAA